MMIELAHTVKWTTLCGTLLRQTIVLDVKRRATARRCLDRSAHAFRLNMESASLRRIRNNDALRHREATIDAKGLTGNPSGILADQKYN
jgi:hypothetical protein